MSWRVVLYIFGMALIFVGEQIPADTGIVRWSLVGVGGLAIGSSALWRGLRSRQADESGIETGHRLALVTTLIGAGSLGGYVLSTQSVAEGLGVGGPSSGWRVVWQVIWPIVWLAGTLPLLAIDHAIRQSPVVAPARRFRQALYHGLTAALGLALLFPVNYLASQHETQWSLAHVETVRPGSATHSIVESLETSVHVYAFLPPDSKLNSEVDAYFTSIEGPKLNVHRVDQTASPRLARRLEVEDNGYLVFATTPPGQLKRPEDEGSEASRVWNERIELGKKLDDAEEALETLDQNVQKRLLSLSSGERIAYLTEGHGELTAEGSGRSRSLQGLTQTMEGMGFQIERLGLQKLPEGVPREADVVMIPGPDSPFMDREIEALANFLDRGGALWIALEPEYARKARRNSKDERPLLGGLLERIGVELGDGVLASTDNIVPTSNNKTDRLNLVTNRFSSHPSTATLSKRTRRLFLFAPTSGYLGVSDDTPVETTVTVRSPSSTWVDRNDNLTFDEESGESREARPMVVAAESEADDTDSSQPWRAVVTADATMLSDLGLGNRGNRQFVYDNLNWLIGASALSGTVDSGEDVRIRHTKEGQAIWFYATVVGIPLLILLIGTLYVWRRRQTGGAS